MNVALQPVLLLSLAVVGAALPKDNSGSSPLSTAYVFPRVADGRDALLAGLAGTDESTKQIYIAADDHTDYFWTADEETYRKAFIEMIDYYLDLTDKTRGNPPDHQSRWNCDGSLWMWEYERNKSPKEFERFIRALESGHMSVPLNALVSCYGGVPVEAVIRGMYYPGRLERKYGVRFRLAVAMENQTHPYGLGAIWAGCGARYSWKGICNCATRVARPGDREHQMYWLAGPDGSRVLMKWYSCLGGNPQGHGNESLGGYAEARYPADAIRMAETAEWFTSSYPYEVIGLFGKGWDDLKTMTDEFVRVAREQTNARRQVVVSNEEDFFVEFERRYGTQLPEVACSYGNEWDLYCASMAEVSARVKRALEKLRAAEAMATLVSLRRPGFMDGRAEPRDRAFMDLGLYWEHDWTADGPISKQRRAEWQRTLARRITAYVDLLHRDAAAELGRMIAGDSESPRWFVFNPLGWVRTDAADVPYGGPVPVHVVDVATGSEVPSQIVRSGGRSWIRILASDVPSVGYRTFDIRDGQGADFAPAATLDDNVIENEFYRVALRSNGAISSVFDKKQRREFARNVEGRWINDLGPGPGSIRIGECGPVSVALEADVKEPLPHITRLTLTRGSRRIAIHNEIVDNFTDLHTWTFAFNLDQPDVRHEECGAVIRARLKADGGEYSPRNARYDWLTLNHFASMSGDEGAVTLSNADCYFMKLGRSTTSRLDTSTPSLNVLVGGQVDGPRLGIVAQGGDRRFVQRFAIQTHSGHDIGRSMRFAMEHQNPFVVGRVPSSSGSQDRSMAAYPADGYSLVQSSDPDVLLWAVKPADDGIQRGIVIRVWNVSRHQNDFALTVHPGIQSATRTTHIETDIRPATVTDGRIVSTCRPQQLQTFRVVTALALDE